MTLPFNRCPPEEYLRRERDARERHEYYDGAVFVREGGGADHSLIAANVIGELGNRLKHGPCCVCESNLRIGGGAFYAYPDVSVFCEPPEFDPLDAHRETVLNPVGLVEVLGLKCGTVAASSTITVRSTRCGSMCL